MALCSQIIQLQEKQLFKATKSENDYENYDFMKKKKYKIAFWTGQLLKCDNPLWKQFC